jgi:hypothetical protein
MLDIKTTTNFSGMRRVAILQVLAYFSILKQRTAIGEGELIPERIGFLFPITREI